MPATTALAGKSGKQSGCASLASCCAFMAILCAAILRVPVKIDIARDSRLAGSAIRGAVCGKTHHPKPYAIP
jgi:hypothetical protein